MLEPSEARAMFRSNQWERPTSGISNGYTQANLVVLPKELAFEFLLFCQRNPKPCPVLDVTDPGSPIPQLAAPEADLRSDLPKYRIFEKGVLTDERTDISSLWTDDMVAFLLGCSFTFEKALLDKSIPVRHIEEERNVPMFVTNIDCEKAGRFEGKMVVSMRPIPAEDIVKTVQITSKFPAVHGAPVQIGHPEQIGINDLNDPDFGDAVSIREGEIPVFWACGVTPQAVAMNIKPELMITHAPGHMFITDWTDEQFEVE
ncbi:putative hydro-lyase [Pseudalkalibacillus berkeleyi]|uniref:Putative hydro-lyase L2716_01385 n=1 Tax=Pseudalkalibacillus berkeleyi TaxID=1069813 RepID=A0ABS9GU45_9BACL|nr:putative hydro-lyase [Pseudalkalibacillus berkeleyi]MCF6136362.1 putative hydro-lyase [Pseudalkalibacillus berkeleyi]